MMDIELHCTEAGSGDPLILLHGNGEDGTCFEHQITYFSRRFHVFAPDTRGHGQTPRGTTPFALDQFACDLADFMDAKGLEAAHLLGFSDGANIALLFTLAHPERAASLVLAGGNLFPEGLLDEVRREDAAAYEEAREANNMRAQELLRLMIDEPHIDPASLAQLHMPTLVVAGTHDMIAEEHTRLIAKSIPGARLRFIEGSHFVVYEDPQEFNRVVGEFYDSIDC